MQVPFQFQECGGVLRFPFFFYHIQKPYIIPTALHTPGNNRWHQHCWFCPAAGVLAVGSKCRSTLETDVCGTLLILR